MSARNNGGPAFPVPNLEHDADFNGMTLRDYFAAKAPDVPGEFAHMVVNRLEIIEKEDGTKKERIRTYETDTERMIRWRWHYADAMLAAREAS